MAEQIPTFRVRFMGRFAAWIGEKKDEPVSYPAPTPAAARSCVEAILWKPAIVWYILRIFILSPIRYFTMRINEVKDRCDPRRPINIEENRTQRSLTGLRDVDYVVETTFRFTKKRHETDNVQKFTEMFRRRLELGQCKHQPYLGRRDFPGFFEPAPEDFKPSESLLGKSIDVGRMLLDRHYGPTITPEFFDASITNGVLVEKGKDRLPLFKSWGEES